MHSRMDSKMFYVSEIQTEAPHEFQTQLQELVYGTLEKLQIPFERVGHRRSDYNGGLRRHR